MGATNFDRLVEEVKGLSPAEQWRLLDFLEEWLAPREKELTEDEFEQQLAREGLISVPPPLTEADVERHKNWKPIEIQGKPLSETILEERR